jgi:Undecaprenyl-phosphate glucose phosphotransferase
MGISDQIVPDTPTMDAARRDYSLSPSAIPYLVQAADMLVLGAVGVLSLTVAADPRLQAASCAIVSALYLAAAARRRICEISCVMRPGRCFDDILIGLGGATVLTLAILFGLDRFDPGLATRIGGFAGASLIGLIAMRYALRQGIVALWRRRILGSSVVVLGVGEQAARFLARFNETKPYLCALAGVFDPDRTDRRGRLEGHPILGGVDDLIAHARTRKIDDVVVALPWQADGRIADLVERLKELPINVHLSTDLIGFELAATPVMGRYEELPLFAIVQRPISGLQSVLKALEDYVLASAALILISPLFLMIAVAIKIDSPGPVFFMQKRLGFNNRPFSIYKFRSMRHSPDVEAVIRQARRGDPRVTRVGRFIRATSLDELPQLLNVLNGTMSLVGPRPHALSHNEEYGRQIRGYFARHKVKPGITGWAQVNGLRGETEALELMEARVRHDIYYANNWSLIFDVKILVMTVLTVLFQKTAY